MQVIKLIDILTLKLFIEDIFRCYEDNLLEISIFIHLTIYISLL